jgi:hypothetical protein
MVSRFHTFLRVELFSNCDFRFLFRIGGFGTLKIKEFGELAQHLIVYSLWMICEDGKTALRYLHDTAFWCGQQSRFFQVGAGPAYAIIENKLPAAGEELSPFRLSEVEVR